MKKYLNYLKYVIEHKVNVAKECFNMSLEIREESRKLSYKLLLHGLTHDMSKFSFAEFKPYAEYDFKDSSNNSKELKESFNKAWQHHKDHNKHHWNYWHERGLDMPYEYILYMVCDWKAMGRKFGDMARQYYLNNKDNIKLSLKSKQHLNVLLRTHDKDMTVTISELIRECREVGLSADCICGYLQGDCGIWITDVENQKHIGGINDFVMDEDDNCLGGTIILKSILIHDNKEASKILTDKFKGYKLELTDMDIIW